MTMDAKAGPPPLVLLYGRLGLVPFVAPVLVGWIWPAIAPLAGSVLATYAALILSFLAGGRWGMALSAQAIDNRIVSLAMLPSLIGFSLLMLPTDWRGWQLAGLAFAHMVQGIWDLRATTLPGWYASLRGQLTLGASSGLVLGIAVFGT